ncbi:M10 family metallopeptidase C-terminal domain-containing protein [Microvirga sp. 17 mud 1-3]|uniref:M10 family metallopeptidase C-terminal domain-containing protein n=1 Tax=Microvirga sp. 17 mud 1-3 TaxID=2082949 RepID=UPI000D6B6606|nr:M10 family metallopeptidase C-terminal domain-containing protein [Microvirga sp. 17 mud 1-3]AWM87694.1 hypothetical protein C4E04_13770 [Microvirga sp. 17 mud 1-3]
MTAKFIRALRNDWKYINNWRGFANPSDGEGVVITYNFMTKVPDEPRVDPLPEINTSFTRYSITEQKVVRAALKIWSAYANIKFVKVDTQDAGIMFGQHRMYDPVEGFAGTLLYDPAKQAMRPTDVWLKSKGFTDGFLTTHRGLEVTLHEIGHALGLKHPFAGKARLTGDDRDSSIMSQDYSGPYNKPGIYDIAALQSIYGPPHKRMSTNTYKIGSDKLIWDGGGIDTVSAASAKAKAYIDMNDGSWSWVGKKAKSLLDDGQSWTGHFTQIEKAIGSRYDDKIVGNELDNTIQGGKGNDTITGGGGADRLFGGAGRDTFVFKSYADMGTLEHHDEIMDLQPGDKIDLRALHTTFLGTGASDALLSSGVAGQAYFNWSTQELRLDADGNGTADFAISMHRNAIDPGALVMI